MRSGRRRPRTPPAACGAALAATALAAALAAAGQASIGLGSGAAHARLAIDAGGAALVTWTEHGAPESVFVPPTGELSHGGALGGPDVSRSASASGVPDAVALRRTPDGRLWALQEIQIGAGSPVELDLSRWLGGPTKLSLAVGGGRLSGTVSFHGAAVSGTTFTLAGKRPRIYVFLDCFGCPGKPGWSAMLGVAPRSDGDFAVYLRPSWIGTHYRATVAGPNSGTTLAPDAQTTISAG